MKLSELKSEHKSFANEMITFNVFSIIVCGDTSMCHGALMESSGQPLGLLCRSCSPRD